MTRLLSPARRMRHRRGAVAVMIALMIPVLLAVAGLAVDLGVWYRESVRLQLAADAGAEGAARLLSGKSAATSDFQSAALLEARGVSGSGWIGALATPVGVSVASDWSQVTVTLSSTADIYFAKFVQAVAPTLHASATAGMQPPPCVLALDPGASSGIKVDNNGSITASGCPIFTDSNSSKAIYLNSGTISGTSVGAAGGVATSNSGGNNLSPAPGNSYQAAQPDPYAARTAPTPGACNYENFSATSYSSQPYSFTPAVFCGNTKIGGNGSTDQFAPGIYYIVNGDLDFNNANVTEAEGVTFVLTGSSAGSFSWKNNANATMTAPTSGPTAGILVWQTCPSSGDQANTFEGGSTLQMSGVMYMPCADLQLTNNVQISALSGQPIGTGVVAATIHATNSAGIAAANGPTGAATQIQLLQ